MKPWLPIIITMKRHNLSWYTLGAAMFLMTIATTSMQRRSVPISAGSQRVRRFGNTYLNRSSESSCIGSVYRSEASGATSRVVSHVQFSVSVAPPEQDCSGLAVALRHFSAVHHAGLHCSSQVLMSQYCRQVCARYPRSTDGECVAAPRCGNYTLLPPLSRDRKNSGVGPAQLQAISSSLKQVARHQQHWHFGYGPSSGTAPMFRQTWPWICRRSGEGRFPGTIVLQFVNNLLPRWDQYQSLTPSERRTAECRLHTDDNWLRWNDDVSNRSSVEGEEDRSEDRALRHTGSALDYRRYVPTELHILVSLGKVGFYPIEWRPRNTKPTPHTQ